MFKKILFICLLCLTVVGCQESKTIEYYQNKVIVNDKEYNLKEIVYDTSNGDIITPSDNTISFLADDEIEIKVLDGGTGSLWIDDCKGLELIDEKEEVIEEYEEPTCGGGNILLIRQYKVTDPNNVSLRMKEIPMSLVVLDEVGPYDSCEYYKEIVFDIEI